MANGGGSRRTTVTVDGTLMEIWVAPTGKSWRAWGDFKGQHITVTGQRSESAAAAAWTIKADAKAKE